MAIKLDEDVTITNGNLLRVVNQGRKTSAKKLYWFTYVKLPDGSEVPVMLTEHELNRIKARAANNQEDVPKKNFFVDFMD